jgi:uncharacterized LabA/DUF88 family protein
MAMATDNSGTLALLIDGDNASPKIVDGLLAEIANYGLASVKRIYGDWTGPNLKGWKECLLEHSIQPVQQFAYTTGKNATDGAMIIDAMDLLYTGRFSGFCIVSSDSDFARLAARIREQGVTVYGFGERKTPRPFITACDKFVYFDVLNAGRRTEGRGSRRHAEGSGGQTGAGENGSGSRGARYALKGCNGLGRRRRRPRQSRSRWRASGETVSRLRPAQLRLSEPLQSGRGFRNCAGRAHR